MDNLTIVQTLEQIRAVNNINEGNVMREAFNLGQPVDTEVRSALTNIVSTEGLQTALLPFINDQNLYKTPAAAESNVSRTHLRHDSKSLAETIYTTFKLKYTDFLTKPLVKGGYGDNFFFKSAADRTEAEAKGLEIIEKMFEKLKTITVADAQEERERAEGESWNQVVCKLGKKYLAEMEKWRASQTDGSVMLSGQSGGVTKFFNEVVGFNPKSTSVRSMFERPAPPGQCNAIYRDQNLEIITREDFNKREYNIGGLGNPDGLAENRKPLWWKSVSDKTWIAPVTCYICETFLYETGVCRPYWEKCDNNMECEHLLPFLEAQLFWSLKMPGIILRTSNGQNIVSREYAPVCRKCNGASHKSGLPILKLSPEWMGMPAYAMKITLNNNTLNRISKNSREYPNAKGRKTHDTIPNNILDLTGRRERCQNVFFPIQQAVNTGFNNIDARRICEILILRYFFYFNKTTLDKVISALLNGEDVEKKRRLLEQHIKFVRKYCKKYKTITYRAEKNLSNFKRFLTKKRINFSNIKNAAGNVIKSVKKLAAGIVQQITKRRSVRTKRNVQSNITKNKKRLDELNMHQVKMKGVLDQIKAKGRTFNSKYKNIIDDPENYTFSNETDKQTFASDALELETLSKRFIDELGGIGVDSEQWIGAGGAIISYDQTIPVDDNIKNKAYYLHWLTIHANFLGGKYLLVVNDIRNMLSKNIEIDKLLLTKGSDYIERWSMTTSQRGNLFSTRYWCSTRECINAIEYYSLYNPDEGGIGDLIENLKKLCTDTSQITKQRVTQRSFLETVKKSERFFIEQYKKKESDDIDHLSDKYIDSIKKGKKLQLFLGQKEEDDSDDDDDDKEMEDDSDDDDDDDKEMGDDSDDDEKGILLLTKENQIKYDIFNFMIDIGYRPGGLDNLKKTKFYKSGCKLPWWEKTALPTYLLGRIPDAIENPVCSTAGGEPIEWVKCKTPVSGVEYFLICSNFDVSLLEKEYEEVIDVLKGIKERTNVFVTEDIQEEAREDVELDIDNADCPGTAHNSKEDGYIKDWLSGNGLPEKAHKRWGKNMLGDDPNKVIDHTSLNKHCFPELYDFSEENANWTCQYEDSADEDDDDDSDDSGSNNDEKDDSNLKRGAKNNPVGSIRSPSRPRTDDGNDDEDDDSDGSWDGPPVIVDGGRRKKKTKRKKRNKKKSRRKNKRKKRTKRRRRKRKKTRRRRR